MCHVLRTFSFTVSATFSTIGSGALTPSMAINSVSKTSSRLASVDWDGGRRHTQCAATRNRSHASVSITMLRGDNERSLLANAHIDQVVIPPGMISAPIHFRRSVNGQSCY